MEKGKDTFTYTYSAKQQEEIRNIRKKYLPREEDKMEQLRRLDRDTTRKGDDSFRPCRCYRMPAFRGGHVLYNGLDEILYSRCGDRAYRNCRCGGCLSAVYPREEKRTGKVGAANFEADRRAVGSKIKKRTGRKRNLPYGPFFIRIPFSLRGCHSPSASGMGVPLGEGGRLHAAIPCPHIP